MSEMRHVKLKTQGMSQLRSQDLSSSRPLERQKINDPGNEVDVCEALIVSMHKV